MRKLLVSLAIVAGVLGVSAGTAEASTPFHPPVCGAHHHWDVHRHCVPDAHFNLGAWFHRFVPHFVHHAPAHHAPAHHFGGKHHA